MPFFKKKKPVASFFSFVPEMGKLCPVSPAEFERPPKWVTKAHDDFKKKVADPAKLTSRVLNISRCPGIRQLMQRGFVVKAWHDFTVTTNGDGESLSWVTPDRMIEQIVGVPPITLHDKTTLADYFGEWPEGRCKTIVKLNMPWRFSLPKGYVFLMMPVPYSDDIRFESAMGVLDPEQSNELNIQLFWNVPNGTTLVRKGTPVCYLVPIKRKDSFDLEVREPTKQERGAGYLRNISMRFLDIPHEINRLILGSHEK